MLAQRNSWSTPNGEDLHIQLEELGNPYEPHRLNIVRGEQFERRRG